MKENLSIYLHNADASMRTTEYKGWVSMILGNMFLKMYDETFNGGDNDELTGRILRVKDLALKLVNCRIDEISLELRLRFTNAVEDLIAIL